MSRDFRMECIRIIDDNKYEVMKATEMYDYDYIGVLFNGSNQEILKNMSNDILVDMFEISPDEKYYSFEWFNNPSIDTFKKYTDLEKIKRAYEPKIVLDCIAKVWQTIQTKNNKLPVLFFVGERNDFEHIGLNRLNEIFINEKPYSIETGWNRCSAMPMKSDNRFNWENTTEIDLRNQTNVSCYTAIRQKNTEGKWELKPGQKIVAYILKENYQSKYELILQDLLSVCRYAEENNYPILTCCFG
jgi:hypothetical protein